MNAAPPAAGLNVRWYRPWEVAALARLFTDTVRRVNAKDYSPEQIDTWAPEPPDLEHWRGRLSALMVLVAEQGPEITGFAALEPDGHLDLLYVHHHFQRRGIATTLCRRIEAEALVCSLDRIFTGASLTARPFFENAGFRMITPQTVTHRGVPFQNYRMEKILR